MTHFDLGSEFIFHDLDLWAYQRGVTLDFWRPGKPADNAFVEALNARLRAECLNAHWFLSLADAAEKLEARPEATMNNDLTVRSGTRPRPLS
jgi:putative transposase